MDLEMAASRLKEILALASEPVAVYLQRADDRRELSGFTTVTGHRFCQLLMRARRGEAVRLEPAGLSCPAAAAAFGFRPLPEKLQSGEGLVGFGIVQKEESGRRMFEKMPRLGEGSLVAVAAAPLGSVKDPPDVIVVEGEPEHLMWLLLADLNLAGGERRHGDTAVLQATCVDATIIPYLEQRCNFSMGCYGCREATDLGPEETVIGFPAGRLEEMLEALSFLAARAVSHSRAKATFRHWQKQQAPAAGEKAFPAARDGALPRLEGELVVKLSPEEVARVFSACLDRDREMALEMADLLQKKIRRILEQPHCLPAFEMKQKLSEPK